MECRVDIIGAALEGLHDRPPPGQRTQEPERHSRLAGPRTGRGNDEAGQQAHEAGLRSVVQIRAEPIYISTVMDDTADMGSPPRAPLRRGWTTGTCAAAAARAAAEGLWTGHFPDPVPIALPNGARPAFALAMHALVDGRASAGVVKDAGDDPDVTHGALVIATVWGGAAGSGVAFRAGAGVGVVTRPGLPIPPGEPAINPVPRAMIRAAVEEAASAFGRAPDAVVEISIPGGEAVAQQTLNPRLGILGGLSILGTTGIVVPYSCAAWIHGIMQGIDVARATGLTHVAGATGRTSEAAVARLYRLPEIALIDMGDFAGGMLKYLKTHPVARVTIAGGFAKISKLAQGRLDLHSRSGVIDLQQLAEWLAQLGADGPVIAAAKNANTAQQILDFSRQANIRLAEHAAVRALTTAERVLAGTGIAIDVVVFDRDGRLAGRSAIAAA